MVDLCKSGAMVKTRSCSTVAASVVVGRVSGMNEIVANGVPAIEVAPINAHNCVS